MGLKYINKMKELQRFREFLNEEKDPISNLIGFLSKIRKILNDPKAGTSPKMLNRVLGLMATVADFMDDEEYIMHLEQATRARPVVYQVFVNFHMGNRSM